MAEPMTTRTKFETPEAIASACAIIVERFARLDPASRADLVEVIHAIPGATEHDEARGIGLALAELLCGPSEARPLPLDEVDAAFEARDSSSDVLDARLLSRAGQVLQALSHWLIRHPDEPPTVDQLATLGGFNRKLVQRGLAELEDWGMVAITPDPGTPAGRHLRVTYRSADRFGAEPGPLRPEAR